MFLDRQLPRAGHPIGEPVETVPNQAAAAGDRLIIIQHAADSMASASSHNHHHHPYPRSPNPPLSAALHPSAPSPKPAEQQPSYHHGGTLMRPSTSTSTSSNNNNNPTTLTPTSSRSSQAPPLPPHPIPEFRRPCRRSTSSRSSSSSELVSTPTRPSPPPRHRQPWTGTTASRASRWPARRGRPTPACRRQAAAATTTAAATRRSGRTGNGERTPAATRAGSARSSATRPRRTSCSECSSRGVKCQFTKETNRRMSSIKQVQDLEKQMERVRRENNSLRRMLQERDGRQVRHGRGRRRRASCIQPRGRIASPSGRRRGPAGMHDLARARQNLRTSPGASGSPWPLPPAAAPELRDFQNLLPPRQTTETLLRAYYTSTHSMTPLVHGTRSRRRSTALPPGQPAARHAGLHVGLLCRPHREAPVHLRQRPHARTPRPAAPRDHPLPHRPPGPTSTSWTTRELWCSSP